MKANELLNDIYVYFNCFDNSKITVKVTGFHDNIVYGVSEYGTHWCQISKIEPIPLTAEILEKNGFIFHDNDGGCYSYFEESYFDQTVEVVLFNVKNENRNCQLHISDENITYLHLMACNYVHQLQHALRLCGIDKTIEL